MEGVWVGYLEGGMRDEQRERMMVRCFVGSRRVCRSMVE